MRTDRRLFAERWFWYDFSVTSVAHTLELHQWFLAPISAHSYFSYARCSLCRFSGIVAPVTSSDGLLQPGDHTHAHTRTAFSSPTRSISQPPCRDERTDAGSLLHALLRRPDAYSASPSVA